MGREINIGAHDAESLGQWATCACLSFSRGRRRTGREIGDRDERERGREGGGYSERERERARKEKEQAAIPFAEKSLHTYVL